MFYILLISSSSAIATATIHKDWKGSANVNTTARSAATFLVEDSNSFWSVVRFTAVQVLYRA